MIPVLQKKANPIVGGAFALLFCLLLAFRLGFFAGDSAVELQVANNINIHPTKETWLTIFQGGRKIGYAHRNFQATKTGYRFSEDVLMHINTMGVVQALHLQTAGNLDFHMNVTSFTFAIDSGIFRFDARGLVRDKLLTLHIGRPVEEAKMEIVLKEPLRLSAAIFETSQFTDLRPGERRNLYVFDPLAMGERPVVITRSEIDETIQHEGRKKRTKKFSLNFMGTTQFAWLDENGNVLREQGMLGITLERTTRQVALAGPDRFGSADLTALASIPANRTITNPEERQELQLRLGNLEEGKFFLDGGRQTWQANILRIRKETLPVASGRTKIGQNHLDLKTQQIISNLLKPGPFIQSDHPLIIAKVREIVSLNDEDGEKARKLVGWLYKHVEKRPVLSVPNAVDTLKNLVGDCNEHAVLLAALARAAGIPADIEAGLVYLRGRFYYHAWNVLYIGGQWVTADAVFGQMPADVTHIRFIRGGADKQMDLLGLIGRVSLEILDVSQSSNR